MRGSMAAQLQTAAELEAVDENVAARASTRESTRVSSTPFQEVSCLRSAALRALVHQSSKEDTDSEDDNDTRQRPPSAKLCIHVVNRVGFVFSRMKK